MNAKAAIAPKKGAKEEKPANGVVVTSNTQQKKEIEMDENIKTHSFIVPQSEKELFERLKYFKAIENTTTVRNYYALGQMIAGFYKKEYGKDKQQKLANETGFSKSTLYKCRQFALNFSSDQVNQLFQGKFTIPWRVVASNLSLETDDFIKQYQAAGTLDELWNALQNSKKSKGAAQTDKPAKEKKIPRSDLEAKLREYEHTLILKDEEIDDLKIENARLAKKLDDLVAQYAEPEIYKVAVTA